MVMTMSRVSLLVLGLISNKPCHAYQLLKEAREAGILQWSHLSEISVYKAFVRLERDGLIEACAHEVGGAGKAYRITERGGDFLEDILFDLLSSEAPLRNDYYLPLFFIDLLPENEAMLALEKRLSFIQRRAESIRNRLEATCGLEDGVHQAIAENLVEAYGLEADLIRRISGIIEGKKKDHGG